MGYTIYIILQIIIKQNVFRTNTQHFFPLTLLFGRLIAVTSPSVQFLCQGEFDGIQLTRFLT